MKLMELLRRGWKDQASRDDSKKGILFIAPRLPEYDRASGDLRLFRILGILNAGYPVFYYNDGMWERFLKKGETKYLNKLNELGIMVVDNEKQLKTVLQSHNISAVVCEFYHLGLKYYSQVKRYSPSTQFIVDSVDVHFLRERMMADILADSSLKKTSEKTKAAEVEAYNLADNVWVVSSLDRDVLVEEKVPAEKINIVPNIHTIRQDVPPLERRGQKTLLFIGGFVHQPNVDAVEFFYREILPLVVKEEPDIRLRIVGDSPPKHIMAMAGNNVEILGYVPDTQSYLDAATVSIVPLRYGAGLKGKVGEAMSAGLPLVTTSIGAQGMSLVSGRDCFIADKPVDFTHAIVRLLREPDLWQLFSENSRTFMRDNFGYESIKEHLTHFFTSISDSRK
jgi:glycosyltransferase involved in cell wall biosynthesis